MPLFPTAQMRGRSRRLPDCHQAVGWWADHFMTDDPLFVSPYLLRPLRSYAQAVRDRQRLASAALPVRSPEGDGGIVGPPAVSVPAESPEDPSTNKNEEDFK